MIKASPAIEGNLPAILVKKRPRFLWAHQNVAGEVGAHCRRVYGMLFTSSATHFQYK